MRMTDLLVRTLRDAPAGAELASHRLLLRAGFIHQLGAGIFTLLPPGRRASDRIEAILREEMDAIGGQELSMPVVNPADPWKETGRWYRIGDEMARFHDRGGRDMVLAMTHEEVVATVARDVIQSYRQLPKMVYHIQTKWRDDPRPRGGLIRVREFVMKDSYSLDADAEGLDRQYDAHFRAYRRIFHRCGIPVVSVLADVGMMGGSTSHEFMYLTPSGEDTLLLCDACGHRANRQVASFRKPAPPPEEPNPVERVATPGVTTIAGLAELLDVPESRTAKAVFQVATLVGDDDEEVERFVFAVVRGDMDVSDTKLRNAVGAKELRPATDAEIRAAGAVPGYASPVGLGEAARPGAEAGAGTAKDTGWAADPEAPRPLVVTDDLVPRSPNLVAGANEEGYHLRNVNYGRDWEADVVTDLVAAEDGAPCPDCGEPLHTRRGVEVGNIFKLGTRYSEALGCTYLDADGRERPVWMGSYGIGSGRLLASVAEEHHDENGLAWPATVAPWSVHVVALGGGEEVSEEVYRRLEAAGVDVLLDDRDESAGVKFNDADLMGMPLRLTVSGRSLGKGGVELKARTEDARRIVAMDALEEEVAGALDALRRAVEEGLPARVGERDAPVGS